jgi:hypothetical protein
VSLYHYAQPSATQQFSDNTERHKAMAGVQYPTKRCHGKFGKHKPQLGGIRIGGKFICSDCKGEK